MRLNHFVSLALAIILLPVHCTSPVQEDGWINLFDGETLKGWSIHSGSAKYRVEDGCIIGQSAPNSPNTFLCTDKAYADFILEFEVLLENDELNSGVQFRRQIAPHELMFWFKNDQGEYQSKTIPADRVYGYQVEIATGGGAGGVYDEARRAMTPFWPDRDSELAKVFKSKKWNTYRIECKGDAIKTIVNGIVVTDFRDAVSLSGIIGLQVHDVGEDATPYQVRWKNIRLLPLD